MAIIINANRCKYSTTSGVRCMTVSLRMMATEKPLASVTVNSVQEMRAAAAQLAEEVRAIYDGSFYISHSVPRGQRKPNGYSKVPYIIHNEDRDPQEEAAAA